MLALSQIKTHLWLIKMKAISVICIGALLFMAYSSAPASGQVAPGAAESEAATANITGTVKQSNGTAIIGADVKLTGPAVLATKTDDHGAFAFRSVPFGIYRVEASSSIGATAREDVSVSGDTTLAIQTAQSAPKSGLRTIGKVTSTASGAKINATSSSITSVTPSDFAFQGNGSWHNLFAQIPGVYASGYTSGGTGPFTAVPGAPNAPVVLSMNGALPYETSTTLDGMPIEGISPSTQTNAGGGVDLNNLPLNAFASADIVRGPGANSPSIVDSIGGSFVLHPPGRVDATHFEVSASNDPYGGIVANAKLALHLGRLSATFIYGVNDSPGPLGTSSVMYAVPTTPATINGQNVYGSISTRGVPNPSGIPNCLCTVTDTLLYNQQQSTAWTAHNGAVALQYDFTPSIAANIFYAGGTTTENVQYAEYPTAFSPSSLATPAYAGSLAPSPTGQTSYTLIRGAQELFNQSNSLLEEKITASLGNGVLRLAALQHNTFQSDAFPLNPANGTYTLFGTANVGATSPGTPTAFNGTPATLTFANLGYSARLYPNNRDLLGSYAIQLSPGLSAGVSNVKSYYNTTLSVIETNGNTGATLFSNIKPPDVSQTTDETRIFLDAVASTKLSFGLSWYFAHADYHVPQATNQILYTDSDFSYSAPRFGAVWQPSHDIAIRASAGGGFALPLLYQLTGLGLQTFSTYYISQAPNLSLKPEESFGFDVGSDVRLQKDTVLSLDLYRTNLYGAFFQTETTSTYLGLPLYSYAYGNVGTSRLEGINLDVHRDVARGYYWRGSLGLTRGYVVSVPANFYNNPSVPCTNCVNQQVVPGTNFNSAAFSGGVPYASASAKLGYRWNADKYIDLSPTYYGSNNIYNTPKAFVELDAHASYALTKNFSLHASFINITGVYDQSYQTATPGYAIPVIAGAAPYSNGAAFEVPYGPRAVVLTGAYKF